MAKGKKSSGKHSTSKGERRSSIGYRDTPNQRVLNKMAALEKGKDVVFTIPNPNKNETKKPFIRQRISGKEFLNRRMGKQ